MKNLPLLAITILISFFNSGTSNAQTNKITPKNVPYYAEFIDTVPELTVPIIADCGFIDLILSEEMRDRQRPFTPAGFEIIGKLSINPDFNLIICGELIGNNYTPYLFVTDKEGSGNSFKKLVENNCQSDTGSYFMYTISVISANQILVVENKTGKRTDKAHPVETSTIFEINKKGEIKRKKG